MVVGFKLETENLEPSFNKKGLPVKGGRGNPWEGSAGRDLQRDLGGAGALLGGTGSALGLLVGLADRAHRRGLRLAAGLGGTGGGALTGESGGTHEPDEGENDENAFHDVDELFRRGS